MTDSDKEIWIARLKMVWLIVMGVVLGISVLYFLGAAGKNVIATVNSSETSSSSTIPQAMDKIAMALKWIAVAIGIQLIRK